MDLFSRKIVGWSAGPSINRDLVLNAVVRAVRRRRPRGTLIHSDQGTQWAAMHGGAFAVRIISSQA
jgi:putative transposase